MSQQNSEESGLDFAAVDATLQISPYQQWLGLTLDRAEPGDLQIRCPYRDEFVSNPGSGSVHGGILAALIDLSGLYVILTQSARVRATIDLRIDYHKPATGGVMLAKAKIIQIGRRMATAETRIESEDGQLLASGRGLYAMASQ